MARGLPDGNIEFLGRVDNQVKVRGFRIELGEIEHNLSQHSEVKECVVMAKGEEDKYLVAYYVANEPIDTETLTNYLLEKLPDYMVPAHFAHLEKMPLTPNGKPNRKLLPAIEITTGADYQAPASEIEISLAKIWSEILKVDQELIGVNRSFFELGGHSLKAVTLANNIFKEHKVKVPIKEVFKLKTIAQIGEYIENEKWLKQGNKHENSEVEEFIFE